ncbi:xaa-Pro aminopeptidase 1 [Octopus sinensis]|uniref:Xaa-Pro aminopeptidase 1 n=1 Tax=Octopus sinensis TaxID=2607531 RepID=A0A6P7SS39_9MOLL|nr:xaa-Pro aminopeptidase 1 [Octopus sinensis]
MDPYKLWTLLCLLGLSLPGLISVNGRLTRVDSDNRPSCADGQPISKTRITTADRVMALRIWFRNPVGDGKRIDAYIVPSEDAHQSEYVAAYDKRRAFISGFKGTRGTAVVTTNQAALWTDGRYFLEAESILDCSWILQRMGNPGVVDIPEWLGKELPSGSRVGASPMLMSAMKWKEMSMQLARYNITLIEVLQDLVDLVWTTTRPEKPNSVINALPLKFAGKSWQDKVQDLRNEMVKQNVAAFIVTSLDEIAWLFNFRAKDVPFNPVAIAYAIVDRQKIRLYLNNPSDKLNYDPTDSETNKKLYEHLNTNRRGRCLRKDDCVEVLNYNAILKDIKELVYNLHRKIWIPEACNYAIYNLIPEDQRFMTLSPVAKMKAVKNDVERKGMENAHIKDAVALIDFVQKLEREVKAGEMWTEISAATELSKIRSKQKYNRGLSFDSISGSGPNGAIIHYRANNVTNREITTKDIYLLDSGGQYLDGTTDVTRTFHFGEPTRYERECYTRVLMGAIDLAQQKFIAGTPGYALDALARRHLWNVGLQYMHGTGHGIGAYLSVHEGPSAFSNPPYHLTPLMVGMFLSDEPGFYEAGAFGIRLETILMVQNATTKYRFMNFNFFKFKPITLVPFEPNLIDYSMLSKDQIYWLNNYNKLCEDIIGPELMRQGKNDALNWLQKRTELISSAATITSSLCLFLSVFHFTIF